MQQPCQYGFRCPYHHYSEDGDYICTYPYIQPTEDDGTFGFPDDGICQLMECDSDLEKILATYENSDVIQKEVDKEWKRMEQENIELVMKLHKQVFGEDEEKKERILTMKDLEMMYEKYGKYWKSDKDENKKNES